MQGFFTAERIELSAPFVRPQRIPIVERCDPIPFETRWYACVRCRLRYTTDEFRWSTDLAFSFHFIKGSQPYQRIYDEITMNDSSTLAPAQLWGAFYGLFGLGSNELIVMSVGDNTEAHSAMDAMVTTELIRSIDLEPTVRPSNEQPVSKSGLYVFRFFGVQSKDIDKIAQLSQEAWTYFEDSTSYKAEPQGLFCEPDRQKEHGLMLLVTWYDGLNSWQVSRRPAPEATRNFRERARLTTFTKPFATRLIV